MCTQGRTDRGSHRVGGVIFSEVNASRVFSGCLEGQAKVLGGLLEYRR